MHFSVFVLSEDGVEAVFEHVLGPMGEGALAEQGPPVAVLEDKVHDLEIFPGVPLPAAYSSKYCLLMGSKWLRHCSRHCLLVLI